MSETKKQKKKKSKFRKTIRKFKALQAFRKPKEKHKVFKQNQQEERLSSSNLLLICYHVISYIVSNVEQSAQFVDAKIYQKFDEENDDLSNSGIELLTQNVLDEVLRDTDTKSNCENLTLLNEMNPQQVIELLMFVLKHSKFQVIIPTELVQGIQQVLQESESQESFEEDLVWILQVGITKLELCVLQRILLLVQYLKYKIVNPKPSIAADTPFKLFGQHVIGVHGDLSIYLFDTLLHASAKIGNIPGTLTILKSLVDTNRTDGLLKADTEIKLLWPKELKQKPFPDKIFGLSNNGNLLYEWYTFESKKFAVLESEFILDIPKVPHVTSHSRNSLEILKEEELFKQKEYDELNTELVQVVFDWNGESEKDLSLHVGDIIKVKEHFADGWMYGEILNADGDASRIGINGEFPGTFVNQILGNLTSNGENESIRVEAPTEGRKKKEVKEAPSEELKKMDVTQNVEHSCLTVEHVDKEEMKIEEIPNKSNNDELKRLKKEIQFNKELNRPKLKQIDSSQHEEEEKMVLAKEGTKIGEKKKKRNPFKLIAKLKLRSSKSKKGKVFSNSNQASSKIASKLDQYFEHPNVKLPVSFIMDNDERQAWILFDALRNSGVTFSRNSVIQLSTVVSTIQK